MATRARASKPGGGRVMGGGAAGAGAPPGHTHTSPSASATASARTPTPAQNAVEGMVVHSPCPLYCHPWYGHWMQPSTTEPCAHPQIRLRAACCRGIPVGALFSTVWQASNHKGMQGGLQYARLAEVLHQRASARRLAVKWVEGRAPLAAGSGQSSCQNGGLQ